MPSVFDEVLTIEECSTMTDLGYPSELVRERIVRENPLPSKPGQACGLAIASPGSSLNRTNSSSN